MRPSAASKDQHTHHDAGARPRHRATVRAGAPRMQDALGARARTLARTRRGPGRCQPPSWRTAARHPSVGEAYSSPLLLSGHADSTAGLSGWHAATAAFPFMPSQLPAPEELWSVINAGDELVG